MASEPVVVVDDITNIVLTVTSASSGTTPGETNNGHGNNLDGVDSSNPGQGHGGPNGGEDASCTGVGRCVDDEGRP